jgi:hypothetical protein
MYIETLFVCVLTSPCSRTLEARLLLVGNQEGKRSLGRQRHRWVDNMKMDTVDIGWDDVD